MVTATIRDVAAQAKVSIKTVSRVINNVTTVKPHTREKVLRVIRKLDYHPNPSARGLSGARSYLIGLLNVANTLPQSITPALGAFLMPGVGGSYATLFVIAGSFALLSSLAILPLRSVR